SRSSPPSTRPIARGTSPWLGSGGPTGKERSTKTHRRGAKFICDDVVAPFGEGERTLIHGDAHMGNLFVDGTRTGFYDWAVVSRSPGVRDVAYFLCNSVPEDVRRAEGSRLLALYRDALAAHGVTLDERTAHEQYR